MYICKEERKRKNTLQINHNHIYGHFSKLTATISFSLFIRFLSLADILAT
jgi:hypothetical protein